MSANKDDSPQIELPGLELEYNSLRGEILKRVELRQQIVSITLTLAGIFLSFGLAIETMVLIYPILAMFLAFGWAQNDFRIRDIATYLRENIENTIPGLGYEKWVQNKRDENEGLGAWRFVVLSHGGVFFVTQLLAIGIGLAKLTPTYLEWTLLGIDLIAVVVVLRILSLSGRQQKQRLHQNEKDNKENKDDKLESSQHKKNRDEKA